MMMIRPIRYSDIDDFLALVETVGVGVTTLQADRELLAERIELSENSFAQTISVKSSNFMFALEDTTKGKIVGVSAIESYIGANDVWYSYRIGNSIHASKELGVRSKNKTLFLTNDLTGCSEVCSLFLDANYRHGNNGRLLSKCRFLFMREYPHLFNEKVIAEMRGFSDADGRSPLWESLGRKFFHMEFSEADYLSALGNKSFVAELMPKHPIYVSFLSEEAQKIIGKVHDNTRPALAMLKKEGFNFNGYIDIFDGGPIIEAFVGNVRAMQESSMRQALICKNVPIADDERYHLVSNSGLENYRALLLPSKGVKYDTVSMSAEAAHQLDVRMGDPVRVVPLRYEES